MTIKLYIAPGTKRYLDYGSLLDTEHGVYWMTEDGDSGRFHVIRGSFEEGETVESVRERFQKALGENPGADIELVVLPPVVTSHDMNPHGLI